MDAALTLDEAVVLAYHLVLEVARREGVEALAIKGPVLTAQGLRSARTSVDVDVLVEPSRRDRLVAALGRLGWVHGGDFESPTVLRRHSVVLRHPRWACELDVHDYYPGFLADPAVVFDLLWQGRTTVALAGQDLPCPARAPHAALAALHYLRDGAGADSPSLAQLAERVEAEAGLAAEVAQVARATGALDTLAPFLRRLGLAPDDTRTAPGSPASVELRRWRLVTQGRYHAVGWLVELRHAPITRKPVVLARAVWPSAAELQRHAVRPLVTPRDRRDARVERWRRGARALPQAVRDVRQDRLL